MSLLLCACFQAKAPQRGAVNYWWVKNNPAGSSKLAIYKPTAKTASRVVYRAGNGLRHIRLAPIRQRSIRKIHRGNEVSPCLIKDGVPFVRVIGPDLRLLGIEVTLAKRWLLCPPACGASARLVSFLVQLLSLFIAPFAARIAPNLRQHPRCQGTQKGAQPKAFC